MLNVPELAFYYVFLGFLDYQAFSSSIPDLEAYGL
jgi:hypothetical protein